MADWTTPVTSSQYVDVLTFLKNRDVDAATLFVGAPSSQPTGAIRYVRASNKFQEWDGIAWVDKVLSVAGGGTGGSSQASARAELGLGTMAVQDSDDVMITDGVIAGDGLGLTNLNASNLGSGLVPTAVLGTGTADATTFLRGDQTYAVLMVDLPYGADKNTTFTPTIDTFYNLTGAGATVDLPTVVGNGGRIVGLVMKAAGSWTIDPDGSELILGAATFTYNWPIYSCLVLKADANNGKWDIV